MQINKVVVFPRWLLLSLLTEVFWRAECVVLWGTAQEEQLLASAMQTGEQTSSSFNEFCLRADFWYKKVNQSMSSLDINLDYGSCNASSPCSAALPGPSTHLLTSGGRKAPAWTAPWEAPHACRQTSSQLHGPEQAFLQQVHSFLPLTAFFVRLSLTG